MYHGRSIGRQLQWLRRICPGRADHLRFGFGDGTIRYGEKEVVIEKVEWDEFDTPTFEFVDPVLNESQARIRNDFLLTEHHITHHRIDDAEIGALEELEKANFHLQGLRTKRPTELCRLSELGLAHQDEKLTGWDDDGKALYHIKFSITPQGRGFLVYLRELESR